MGFRNNDRRAGQRGLSGYISTIYIYLYMHVCMYVCIIMMMIMLFDITFTHLYIYIYIYIYLSISRNNKRKPKTSNLTTDISLRPPSAIHKKSKQKKISLFNVIFFFFLSRRNHKFTWPMKKK